MLSRRIGISTTWMRITTSSMCLCPPTLYFTLKIVPDLDEIWIKLDGLFGKHDEMRGHMLEVELNSLDPRNFDNIQDFFMKFKSLLLHLKGHSVDKSTQET
jgi:hypothetical protein